MDIVGALHDLQGPSRQCLHPVNQLTAITSVGPNHRQARKFPHEVGEHECGARAVLDVRGVDHDRQHEAKGIDDEMTLPTTYFLARIIATRPPFSVVFTDWLSTMAALGLLSLPTD